MLVGFCEVVMGGGGTPGKTSVIRSVLGVIAISTLVVGQLSGVVGDRTFTKVYEPITGTAACFKRLNGTDEIGCRSSANGAVGILHLVNDSQSLQWVLKDGPHSPYVVLMYPEQFSRTNLMKFQSSKRVNGVLLLPEKKGKDDGAPEKTLSSFSTDLSCPNNQFGIYNTSSPKYCPKWNTPGTSTLFDNFEFPIFFVKNTTESETLLNCYETSNKPINGTPNDWPLCAAQLKSFMMAAKDTPTCLRRSTAFSLNPQTTKVCDPLGDQNLLATLLPQNETAVQSKSALVIAARMDGASMFDEMSPSADSSVTGLVTLLAILKHLAAKKDEIVISADSEVNSVYFILFNGEAFGYIGSSRMAYDMTQGRFPLKLDEIRYFLELNQVAPTSKDQSYFLHQSDLNQSAEFTSLLVDQARLQNLSLTTIPTDDSSPWGVPPSSLQSFLRERPDLTGVVLTNHRETYQNPFYNSIFDTKENIKYKYGERTVVSLQQKIASLAAAVSNSVIQLLTKTSSLSEPVSADLEAVDELLHCYLQTSNCSIFRSISGFEPPPNSPMEPYPMYVGVAAYTNTLTQITKYIMVSYLGNPVENATTEDVCFGRNSDADPSSAHRPRYFINGTCFDCPQVNMTEAKSPAFIIPNYDWSSGKYSTWTESVWQKFSVKIFLKPSLAHEILTLISGIVVVIVSFAVVRFVNQKSELIFPSRTDAMVC